MDWTDLREKALSAMGGLLAIAVVSGLFFLQCVYPFIRDESETANCSDEEFAEVCDDPETLAGFMALICGRDEVVFVGSPIRLLNPGPGEPSLLGHSFTIRCGDFNAVWEIDQGQRLDDFDDYKKAASNKDARAIMEVIEGWYFGDLTIEDARIELLGAR